MSVNISAETVENVCHEKKKASISGAERGQNATVACFVGPAGSFVPPALLHARKSWKGVTGAATGP